MSKMDVQVVSTEMTGLKDNMWKLTGRVQLMEKFIQKQFGKANNSRKFSGDEGIWIYDENCILIMFR